MFLVMERLRGIGVEELRERAGGTVGLTAAVGIVEQLLDVLAAAHAQGIVHRDVKPGNLFVTGEGEVKVLDFGIARIRAVVANDLSLTGAATIMGTPTFMAPEQALPGMAEIDERTDVWAAGATLFALLSGHTVHEGATLGEVLFKASMEPCRSLLTSRAEDTAGDRRGRRWGARLREVAPVEERPGHAERLACSVSPSLREGPPRARGSRRSSNRPSAA